LKLAKNHTATIADGLEAISNPLNFAARSTQAAIASPFEATDKSGKIAKNACS
jgi:hypothetical protein